MYQSLTRLAELPDSTQVYCAHEYTLSNFRFACAVEPDNQALLARQAEAEDLRSRNQPTVPSVIELEKQTNPFLRCEVPGVRAAAEKHAGRSLPTPADVFATVRSWKDSF
jgi:hydroxyacylglutathione hydrolase